VDLQWHCRIGFITYEFGLPVNKVGVQGLVPIAEFISKVSQGHMWKGDLLGGWVIFLHDVIEIFELKFELFFVLLDILSLSHRIWHSIRVYRSWGGLAC
jgi:hypothetical protein